MKRKGTQRESLEDNPQDPSTPDQRGSTAVEFPGFQLRGQLGRTSRPKTDSLAAHKKSRNCIKLRGNDMEMIGNVYDILWHCFKIKPKRTEVFNWHQVSAAWQRALHRSNMMQRYPPYLQNIHMPIRIDRMDRIDCIEKLQIVARQSLSRTAQCSWRQAIAPVKSEIQTDSAWITLNYYIDLYIYYMLLLRLLSLSISAIITKIHPVYSNNTK